MIESEPSSVTGHFLRVAETVLLTQRRPMSAAAIVDLARDHGMLETIGRTPKQTMKARISVEIRRHGPTSVFVRTAPGMFYLRRLTNNAVVYEAPPKTRRAPEEDVLVFPTSRLTPRMRFQGIRTTWTPTLDRCLAGAPMYLDRLLAEQRDDVKQVLTYVLVVREGRLLSFERGAYQRVAEFLRGRACVGFGGHVTRPDVSLFSADYHGVVGNAARELAEELSLPASDNSRLIAGEGLEIVGVLNDDSSPVGRRHFAVVFRYEVSDDPAWLQPRRGERSINKLHWIEPSEAAKELERFEYWSQLCLRTLYPDVVKNRPSYTVRARQAFTLPHILCVLGEIGSGKTQTTSVLVKDFGYVEVNSGEVLARLLDLEPLTPENEVLREGFQRAARAFIHEQDGPPTLAQALLEAAAATGSDRVVIDGIRQPRTLAALAAPRRGAQIARLYVQTPPDVAFRFYRARRGRATTFDDFLRVRSADVEQDVASLIAESDAVIYNAAGARTFRTTVRRLLAELGITRRAAQAVI